MPTLTDSTIRTTKPDTKPFKLYDERGLFLLVTPTGGRLWRFKYKIAGREKLLALGQYPDVPLKLARDRRDAARRKLADNVDPSAERQEAKTAHTNNLAAVAVEWLEMQQKAMAPETVQRIRDRLDRWILPTLGSRPIAALKPADLLPLLRRIEAAGRHETAHRTRADVSRIMRHAVATGRAERDVTVDLRGALAPVKTAHFAALTDPGRVAELLRAIDGYRGQPVVEIALKLAPYLFVRPGELRGAEWTEFDLEANEWRIPATKTKMRRLHIVPIARQVRALLDDLAVHSGGGRYLFPTIRDTARHMSENTLNAALRRLGYGSGEMSSHGFRSVASTLLNEMGVSPELIEKQLAHADQNAVRDAYNRAERLTERRAMMQRWADHLDVLRLGKKEQNVVAIRAKRT